MRDAINSGNDCSAYYFKLANDIDLSEVCGENITDENGNAVSWTPIGDGANMFAGTFDGGEHTISNLYINNSEYEDNGLFGCNKGIIKNLNVDGTVIGKGFIGGVAGENLGGTIINCSNACAVDGASCVGGVVGRNGDSDDNLFNLSLGGKVINCRNIGDVTGFKDDSSHIGGVVGYNVSSEVTGCSNTGSIGGKTNIIVGGIVGGIYYGSVVTKCTNSGYVNGTYYIGGVTGHSDSADLRDCNNYGKVEGTGAGNIKGDSIGGIVGYLFCNEKAAYDEFDIDYSFAIENCHNVGEIIGYNEIGGVVGMIDNYNDDPDICSIINCTNSGAINGRKKQIGGIVGVNNGAIIKDCDNSGTVGGRCSEVGGIVGRKGTGTGIVKGNIIGGVIGANYCNENVSCIVESCHNTGEITGYVDIGGVVGYALNYNDNPDVCAIVNCTNSGAVTGNDRRVGGIAGINSGGAIKYSNNIGAVGGKCDNVGGIVGWLGVETDSDPYNTVSEIINCYNTGDIGGTYAATVGGISGYNADNSAYVLKSSYNTGEITGNSDVGGVTGSSEDDNVINCYYRENCAVDLNGNEIQNYGVSKTEEEFASGDVARLLQDGQEDKTVLVWGQDVISELPERDLTPILTNDSAKMIYKATFMKKNDISGEYEEWAERYTNSSGKFELIDVSSDEDFSDDILGFHHWTADKDGLIEYIGLPPITDDVILYAVFEEKYGAMGDVKITTTYGTGAEHDLSGYVKFIDSNENTDKFEYIINDDGNEELNATIEGAKLIVPNTANAGEYNLIIKVTAKNSALQLFSDDSAETKIKYGVKPVNLDASVIIERLAEETPEIEIDYLNETLTGFENSANYKINGETIE